MEGIVSVDVRRVEPSRIREITPLVDAEPRATGLERAPPFAVETKSRFVVDDGTGQLVFQVRTADGDDVLFQLPDELALHLRKLFDEMMRSEQGAPPSLIDIVT